MLDANWILLDSDLTGFPASHAIWDDHGPAAARPDSDWAHPRRLQCHPGADPNATECSSSTGQGHVPAGPRSSSDRNGWFVPYGTYALTEPPRSSEALVHMTAPPRCKRIITDLLMTVPNACKSSASLPVLTLPVFETLLLHSVSHPFTHPRRVGVASTSSSTPCFRYVTMPCPRVLHAVSTALFTLCVWLFSRPGSSRAPPTLQPARLLTSRPHRCLTSTARPLHSRGPMRLAATRTARHSTGSLFDQPASPGRFDLRPRPLRSGGPTRPTPDAAGPDYRSGLLTPPCHVPSPRAGPRA